MQLKLPATVTRTIYIHAYKSVSSDEYTVFLSTSDMSDIDGYYILLGKEDVTLNVPQNSLPQGRVNHLLNQKSKILAESQQAIQIIDEQIQSLTLIENK